MTCLCFGSTRHRRGIEITLTRNPKQCGGQEIIVPDTSNGNYGTITGHVRRYRNCSSRNLFWHKKQRYVYSSGPHTRTSYQDISENFQRLSKKGLLYYTVQRILEDLHARTCYEHPRRTFMQAPMQSIFKSSMQGQGYLQDLLTRTCTRSCTDT